MTTSPVFDEVDCDLSLGEITIFVGDKLESGTGFSSSASTASCHFTLLALGDVIRNLVYRNRKVSQ